MRSKQALIHANLCRSQSQFHAYIRPTQISIQPILSQIVPNKVHIISQLFLQVVFSASEFAIPPHFLLGCDSTALHYQL